MSRRLCWPGMWQVPQDRGCPPSDQPLESGTAAAGGTLQPAFFFFLLKFLFPCLYKCQKLIFGEKKKEENIEKVVLILPLRDVLAYFLFTVIFLFIFMYSRS